VSSWAYPLRPRSRDVRPVGSKYLDSLLQCRRMCRPVGLYVKRTLKLVVFVLAAVYFVVDAIFLTIATPLARWMARQRVFVRLRKWIGSLGPYPSLALFAVPVIVLEPVKPVAAYLIATGRIAAGVMVLIVGEILKLVIVERLFQLCRRKLLKIPMFARGYAHWRQGVDWIVSMRAWQAARRWVLLLKSVFRSLLMQFKRSFKYRRLFAQSR
jgi:hypothetical protein